MSCELPLPMSVIEGNIPMIHPIVGRRCVSSYSSDITDNIDAIVTKIEGIPAGVSYRSLSWFGPSDGTFTSTLFVFGAKIIRPRDVEMSDFFKITYTDDDYVDGSYIYYRIRSIIGLRVMYDYYESIIGNFYIDPKIAEQMYVYEFMRHRRYWYLYVVDTFGYQSPERIAYIDLINRINNKSFYSYYKVLLTEAGISVGYSLDIYVSADANLNIYDYGYDSTFLCSPFDNYIENDDLFVHAALRLPLSHNVHYYGPALSYDTQVLLRSPDSPGLGGMEALTVYYEGTILIFSAFVGYGIRYYDDGSQAMVKYWRDFVLSRSTRALGNFTEDVKRGGYAEYLPPEGFINKCCLAECFGITE